MSARRNLQIRKRRRQKLELPVKLLEQQLRIVDLLYKPRKDSAIARAQKAGVK